MGGNAFAHAYAADAPTLNTPRMSPEVYTQLKEIYLRKLQDCFPHSRVACLTEAPEKKDYGDMDIFVALDEHVDLVALANTIGAAGIICHGGKVQRCTAAVPRDGSHFGGKTVVYKPKPLCIEQAAESCAAVSTEIYAQVDIEIMPSHLLGWHTFCNSYSDMQAMIGRILANVGLRISDVGLEVRMKELHDFRTTMAEASKPISNTEGLMFLSNDAEQLMHFLGLSPDEFHEGFATRHQLFQWLGKCRLLSPEIARIIPDEARERELNQKRPVYTGFYRDWLPAHLQLPVYEDSDTIARALEQQREVFFQEAVDFFGKRAEYEETHAALVSKISRIKVITHIKPIIAECSGRKVKTVNEIARAFLRLVGCTTEGNLFICETGHKEHESPLALLLETDGTSLRNVDEVRAWVAEHWEEVRHLGRTEREQRVL